MRLLINADALRPPLTGIGNYTYHLLDNLRGCAGVESIECFQAGRFVPVEEVFARLAHRSDEAPEGAATGTRSLRTLLRAMPGAYLARETLYGWRFRLAEARLRGAIYHEPGFVLRPYSGPSIATIHDLSFFYYPEFHPAPRARWLNEQLPRTLQRADFLLTDSDRVRQELIRDFAVPAERVRSVPLGAPACFAPLSQACRQHVLQRYGLESGRYVLFVGTLEPRKGVSTLLDAWSALPAAIRRDRQVVLAGSNGWGGEELASRIAALQAAGELRHLHYVPLEDLPALYCGAAVFVFPAIYEGFGLPVLEAMQCGVPVICTADTAMSDFAAEAALTFPAEDHAQLAAGMQRIFVDEDLRERLAGAGLRVSAAFSWQRCARETFAVYREVAR